MARLSISSLGPLHITLDGEPATDFATDKSRALLIYLAIESEHPHRRDALAGLLWPDQPQRKARQNLRQALSYLRQAIGDQDDTAPFLLVNRETVQFNPDSDHWLDVVAFNALVEACRAHRHRHIKACIPCIRRLEKLVDLYRGDFLEHFFLSDSGAFEEWALLQREWLRRQVTEALAHLATHYERRRNYERARRYAWRQVDLEPWHEEAHQHLMRLLTLDGQRSAALAQYETCRRMLAEELDIEPATETVALYEHIRAQEDLHISASVDNLPPSPTPFVGREMELAELAELLANPDCRLVTLVGPGGIGKTRLALQAAAAQVGAFTHGITFVPLAPTGTVDHLTTAIIAALGIPARGDQDSREQLFNYLHQKENLLVLDSMERVTDGSPLLSEMLARAPGTVFLVTSRERLNLQEEWVYEVRGLTYPEDELLRGQETYSAIDLFRQRASQVDRRFDLETEAPHVVHICRLVEGMPLGIELAAAWVAVHPCREIAREIEYNLDILTTRLRNVPERHRSIRAAFEYSWKLLTETERTPFAQLSVFRGGFRREAATAVTGASLATLSALLDKSLIRRVSADRYDMHELLRQYAAEKLQTNTQEDEKTRLQHARYFAAFLTHQEPHLHGPNQRQALLAIAPELENVRQAWRQAVSCGWVREVEQSMESLYQFLDIRCRFQEGVELFAYATDRWRDDPEKAYIFGRVLSRQGAFYRHLGLYRHARTCLEQSLAICSRSDMQAEHIFCLVNLANVARSHGKSEEMEQLVQYSLTLSRQTGDPWGIASSLSLLGLVRYRSGDVAQAEALLQESLAVGRQTGDQRLILPSLNRLADVACHQGNYVKAQAMFEECLSLSRELDDQYSIAMHLNNLGTVLHVLEQYAQAQPLYQESLDICRKIGDQAGQAIALSNLGEVAYALRAHVEAQQFYQEGLSIGRKIQDQWTEMACLNNLGEIACTLKNYESARTHFVEAIKLATETRALTVLLKVLVNLAVLLAKQGQTSRAAAILRLASRHPASEQATQEKAGRLGDEMGLTLPDTDPDGFEQSAPLDMVVAEILAEISPAD
jgi:DNA-binding SARP family transcriptional activator/predicted ATPase/Tfp pilus assembly protein PilF